MSLCTYTCGKDVLHHVRHVRLVLCALSLQEVDDDAKASSADFWIDTVLISVQVEQTNHQDQSLDNTEVTPQLSNCQCFSYTYGFSLYVPLSIVYTSACSWQFPCLWLWGTVGSVGRREQAPCDTPQENEASHQVIHTTEDTKPEVDQSIFMAVYMYS